MTTNPEAAITCPDCGAFILDPAAEFCARCGAPLSDDGDDGSDHPPPPTGSEHVHKLIAEGRWKAAIKAYAQEQGVDGARAKEAIEYAARLTDDGDTLRRRFVNLGTLTGKSRNEILWAVGPCQGTSQLGDRYTLKWERSGFILHLGFNAQNICTGVQFEWST